MKAQKLTARAPAPAKSQPSTAPSARKAWVRKTPVEIVLDQIGKQERKVEDMRDDLKKEERELQKLQQAKKVLEGS